LVLLKSRSSAIGNRFYDTARGVTQALTSTLTNGQFVESTSVTAFNSNGFTLVNSGTYQTNQSGYTYVAWQWKGATSNATNTSGSITSNVRANQTAGFSIATYTGTGSNATIGHGLGATPSMVTVKCRSTAGESWHTYHVGLSSLANTVYLNGTAAQSSFPTCFNSMSTLNSTVFSLGTDTASNASGRTYVAYVFAPIAGYSAFGKYTGNGSTDGPFVYTGFRPRFVMIKRTDSTENWKMLDSSRDPYNVVGNELFANTSTAESTGNSDCDFLSNGFKLRDTYANINASGGTYIYMAFAENPFKYSNAR
jgi:hypothetical protein